MRWSNKFSKDDQPVSTVAFRLFALCEPSSKCQRVTFSKLREFRGLRAVVLCDPVLPEQRPTE